MAGISIAKNLQQKQRAPTTTLAAKNHPCNHYVSSLICTILHMVVKKKVYLLRIKILSFLSTIDLGQYISIKYCFLLDKNLKVERFLYKRMPKVAHSSSSRVYAVEP